MCIRIHSGDLQGGVDVRLNMCDNILLYSNPFKDFFIKRHKSNLHLINRNDFFSLIYKLRIMFISIHCEISDNSCIEGEIASMKNVECHLQINRYPTIYQTRSYSFSLQILRIFIRKKSFYKYGLVLYFSVEHERLIFMFTCLARYMGNICNRKKFVEFCLQYKFSSQSCVAKPAVILLIITIHLLLFIKALDILKSIK